MAAKGARGDFSVSIQTSDHLNLQHPLLRGAMRMLLKDALRIYVFANDAAVCLLGMCLLVRVMPGKAYAWMSM